MHSRLFLWLESGREGDFHLRHTILLLEYAYNPDVVALWQLWEDDIPLPLCDTGGKTLKIGGNTILHLKAFRSGSLFPILS